MPNWCNNTLTLEHEDPAMIARAKAAFADGRFLAEFIPVPESLQIVAGSVGDPVEQAKLIEDTNRNLEVHGYGNWYDYCVNEWGTKWDIGADGNPAQDIPGGLMLGFDSAWAPPCAAYEKLTEQGFRIRAMYYEGGMAFAGIWEEGNDDYYEYGGLDSKGIADTLPAELDEAFGISESAAEWEAENAEEDQE
jgi:hypothetical protein